MKDYIKFGDWIIEKSKITRIYKEEIDKIKLITDTTAYIHRFDEPYQRDNYFDLFCDEFDAKDKERERLWKIRDKLWVIENNIFAINKKIGQINFKLGKLLKKQ